MNIYIGNLPYKTTDEELIELFKAYGDVSRVNLISDRETGRAKGYGFIEIQGEQCASALEALNGTQFGGRTLVVTEANPRKPKSTRTTSRAQQREM